MGVNVRLVDPYLTPKDLVLLDFLLEKALIAHKGQSQDLSRSSIGDENLISDRLFQYGKIPVVSCAWDYDKLEKWPGLKSILEVYINFARKLMRHPNDVVFLSHIILYLVTSLPSAIFLFYRFTYVHGICHVLMQIYFAGPFTLMLHNCIHQNGLFSRKYPFFDVLWVHLLSPLMGHTWHSYYYHHIKHHHVEGNGPEDISSTIRYQRDSVVHFIQYIVRFLALAWLELPMYFIKKKRFVIAIKSMTWELSSFAFFYGLFYLNPQATVFTILLPFSILRVGLMIGNFGQHAFIDWNDPKSDFRSSITLIDVTSNRFCFNDGYHTSHHLNPRRHWFDHPEAFFKAHKRYENESALVFHNIDFLMITYRVLRKDYLYLADCFVPMSEKHILMTRDERAAMLRLKTQKFSDKEIQEKFYGTVNK